MKSYSTDRLINDSYNTEMAVLRVLTHQSSCTENYEHAVSNYDAVENIMVPSGRAIAEIQTFSY